MCLYIELTRKYSHCVLYVCDFDNCSKSICCARYVCGYVHVYVCNLFVCVQIRIRMCVDMYTCVCLYSCVCGMYVCGYVYAWVDHIDT